MKKLNHFLIMLVFFLLFSNFHSYAAEQFKGNLVVSQAGYNSVKISWQEQEEYEKYELFRCEEGSESGWRKIKNVVGNSTYNYNLQEDVTYYYKIRPYIENGTEKVYGEFSEDTVFSLGEGVKAPTDLAIEQSGTHWVTIEWDEVENATGYALYRSESNGSWERIKNVASNSAKNYNLAENVEYCYMVCAYMDVEGERIYSNGSEEAEFSLNHGAEAPENLVVEQTGNTTVHLYWNAVEEAEYYELYRKTGDEDWIRIKKVSGTSTFNYHLIQGEQYKYKICVCQYDGQKVYGDFSESASICLKELDTPQNLNVNRYNDRTVQIEWDATEDATGYVLYRRVEDGEWSRVKTITGSERTYNYNLEEGKKYQYKIIAFQSTDYGKICSQDSDVVTYWNVSSTPEETAYRALLIGETAYMQTLHGPDNDVNAMEDILSVMGYEVYSETDATKSDILALIEVAFMDATEDDVSLFYYSGHGITGAGEEYSGSLHTVDYQYLTTAELAEALSEIPGQVVVILDSCGSGAAISGESDENCIQLASDSDAFNDSIVEVFASYELLSPLSGELRQQKFYVLTSSAYEENSITNYVNGVWGGLFTRGISAAVGRDYNTAEWANEMVADSNGDKKISLNELYLYCLDYVDGRQSVQVYPDESDIVVFRSING